MSNRNLTYIFVIACLISQLSHSERMNAQISAQPTTNRPSDLPTETRRPVSISGAVVLDDGVPLSEPVQIQRVCGNIVHGENYSDSRGKFTIWLDENSGIGYQQASEGGGNSTMGAQLGGSSSQTTRTQLWNCEVRASLPGYYSGSVSLAGRDFSVPVTLSNIVLRRIGGSVHQNVSAKDLQVPRDARKEFDKGREEYFKKKYEDADKHLEKAVALYPEYASALDLRGREQRARRMDDEAEKSFHAAITADDKFIAPYLHLAALLASHSRWPDVIVVSDKAIELDADGYTEPYYFKAVAHLMSKQVPEAKLNIGKVLQIDKDHRFPRAELMMGNILRSEGDDGAAVEHMKNYLSLEPNSPDAAKVQEYLAKVGQERSVATPEQQPH
jgi:tetratricopeptide (TPR) repeat protein